MKNRKEYQGILEDIPGQQIFLNVDNLVKGTYTLKIMLDKKVIKEITFKK